jgi:hypothetical protein
MHTPETGHATTDRDQQILSERRRGDTLREIAVRHDVSIEGARYISNKAARTHVAEVLCHMWSAQNQGELLVLAIPDCSEPDQQQAIDYLSWLLSEMPDCVELRVHYRPTVEGHVVFGLEDTGYTPTEEVAP